MSHNSKLITMFAVLISKYISNAGCQLAFTVQAFFMPGHKVYHNWYPCTPAWSVNAPTAFEICDKQRERHGYFYKKNVLLCLTIQKFSMLISTASKRPPTKRVLLLSPLPAILTPTLPLTASTFTDVLFVTCVQLIQKGTSSPDVLIFPESKQHLELLVTKLSFSLWLKFAKSVDAMWQNVKSGSANAISLLGGLAIRNSRSTIVTSHLCSHLHKLANYYSIAQPAINVGCAGILYPKNNSNLKLYENTLFLQKRV